MFSTLTEEDLQVLGITAFGPRKKLLMAINFLSTHHHSHGHLSPQIYHHHPPHQYMQAAAMGGRLPHGPQLGRGELKHPPGIPAGFEQKIQQQQQQQHQQQHSGNSGAQNQSQQGQVPGGPTGQQNKTSPGQSGEGAGGGAAADTNGAAGNGPPKFSGSAAPGAERRTSNSS